MKSKVKIILATISLISLLSLSYPAYILWQAAEISAAYRAKIVCSGVFVSRRTPESVLNNDLVQNLPPLLQAAVDSIATDINYQEKFVTGGFANLIREKAIYRPGLGCTLAIATSEAELRSQPNAVSLSVSDRSKELELVEPNSFPAEIDRNKIEQLVEVSFEDKNERDLPLTRALVIVYRGRIIAERYAPGFTADMPLIGWSMTKSVTNALTGILVKQGKLSLSDKVLMPQWTSSRDRRSEITLEQLLHMNSGLQFEETYDSPFSDCLQMLYGSKNMAAYAADKLLEDEPGSDWDYSSGTTNIIMAVIKKALGGTQADYFSFPRRELFDKLGMTTAVIEPDAAGSFVGSSSMYASARDWARFGLLYLQDGVWNGDRILPEGWVEFSRTPAPNSEGKYGAQFWLMKVPTDTNETVKMFNAQGYDGQYTMIVPDRELVVVRLGKGEGNWKPKEFMTQLIAAID